MGNPQTKGSPTTAPVDEKQYDVAIDGGATFRTEGGKYQYNWGTPKAGQGFYHRIGVRLDDGQTYFVNIGLK